MYRDSSFAEHFQLPQITCSEKTPGTFPCSRIDLQKINQVLIEPDRDVIVLLNLACMPQSNLIDEPPQVGDAAKESFGATRIGLLHLLSVSNGVISANLTHERKKSIERATVE